jgi:ketosteroid isomerase-like protein
MDSTSDETLRVINDFNLAFNRHDVAAIMALMTEDCLFDGTDPAPDGTPYIGQAAVKQYWEDFFKASPSAVFEWEEVFGASDKAVVRWTYKWVDVEGKTGHVRGVDIFRVSGGKVAEKRSYVKG